jgi:hypothetical protein
MIRGRRETTATTASSSMTSAAPGGGVRAMDKGRHQQGFQQHEGVCSSETINHRSSSATQSVFIE